MESTEKNAEVVNIIMDIFINESYTIEEAHSISVRCSCQTWRLIVLILCLYIYYIMYSPKNTEKPLDF